MSPEKDRQSELPLTIAIDKTIGKLSHMHTNLQLIGVSERRQQLPLPLSNNSPINSKLIAIKLFRSNKSKWIASFQTLLFPLYCNAGPLLFISFFQFFLLDKQ